jgi:hypothetical protein
VRRSSTTSRQWLITLLRSAVTLSAADAEQTFATLGSPPDSATCPGGIGAVDVSRQSRQIADVKLVAHGAGDLFGAAGEPAGQGILFVNDGTNTLELVSVR